MDALTHVRGQIEFEFPGMTVIGSLDEAIQLWEAQSDRARGGGELPEGWECVGSGGTRVVYKAPSGVCYKVCHEYDDEDETHNEVEHKNMRRIAREGKLPPKWKVPPTHLHVFSGKFRRWDYHMRKERVMPGRVVILATEYIDGLPIGWGAPEEDRAEMVSAFREVGLSDTGGANAIKTKEGEYFVVDAAEWMEPEEN